MPSPVKASTHPSRPTTGRSTASSARWWQATVSSTFRTAASYEYGPDRLAWLHSLTTQDFESLEPGRPTAALVLSPQGHVEHAMYGVDDGTAFTAHVEPGAAPPLVDFLDRMRFMMRVEVEDLTDELAVAWRPG